MLGRLLAGDHLQQAHHGRGVEEVHAHDPSRVAGGRRDRGDGQRRGVGRQDTVGADDLRQAAEELVLELQALGRGLDHEVAGGELGELGDRLHALECRLGGLDLARVPIGAGGLPARGFLGQALADPLHTALQGLGDRVVQQRLRARAAGELRDAGAHRPRADDTDDASDGGLAAGVRVRLGLLCPLAVRHGQLAPARPSLARGR